MKKDGLTTLAGKLKNINKMSPNELDETNKILEKELKKRKLNLNNLTNFTTKGQMSPASKAKTSASNSAYRENLTNPNLKLKQTKQDISFQSMRNENFDSENSQLNTSKILTPNYINTDNNNLNNNKSTKRNYFSISSQQKNEKVSFSNREYSENNKTIKKDTSLEQTSNFKDKLNSTGIQFKTIRSNKQLIPMNFNTKTSCGQETEIRHALDKLKLCQKIHLPTEKNYFISEKNMKLLEQAINEKECDINILRGLLNMAKDDIDLYKNRYESINIYIEEILNENSNLLKDIENISEEKKQLKENFDEYSDKYNRMLIFLKKFGELVNTFISMKKSYDEFLELYSDSDTKNNLKGNMVVECFNNEEDPVNSRETFIQIPKKAEFLKLFKDILNEIQSKELKIYVKFYDKNNLNKNQIFKNMNKIQISNLLNFPDKNNIEVASKKF